MSGLRGFALAVLLAVALLPKTGWIVRNQFDMLTGGWGTFGTDLGVKPTFGFVPHRLFREPSDSPMVRALMTFETTQYQSHHPLDRAAEALADPSTRSKIRGSVLRQSFLIGIGGERKAKKADLAVRMLPLAEEGEREQPDNAFYPASAWALLTYLGRQAEADAALARAARCTRYDDEARFEASLISGNIERRNGYRGQIVRLLADSEVLLPEYAAIGYAANRLAETSSLSDVRRRDVLRLALIMGRTAQSDIGIYVAGGLVFRAVGRSVESRDENARYPERFAAYAKANPDYDLAPAHKLFDETRGTSPFDLDLLRRVFSSPALPFGAALLLATIGALALSFRSPGEDGFRARLRRAPWAWIAALPFVFGPGIDAHGLSPLLLVPVAVLALGERRTRASRPVVIGLGLVGALTLAFALRQPGWLVALLVGGASIWLRPTWRPLALVLGVSALSFWTAYRFLLPGAQRETVDALLLAAAGLLGLRMALPVRKDLEWSAALFAALYLGAITFGLSEDAQQGAMRQAFEAEADRFRIEHGIDR